MWDVEKLYIYYNIKQENLKTSWLDENAMGGSYPYNDYKISMQKYSDTFDYGNWNATFKDYTVEKTDLLLDNYIMQYYKKFIINFSNELI